MARSKRVSGQIGLADVAMRVRAGTDTATTGASSGDCAADRKRSQRAVLAEFCRLAIEPNATARTTPGAAGRVTGHGVVEPGETPVDPGDEDVGLPPRLRQTLAGLLAGDSEKQVARRLAISPHTVHVYVKSLYRRFGVSSRGELLARWVRTRPTDAKHQ